MRRLRRVYFDYELTPVIELDENQSRKLKTVLRAEQGDIVEVLTKEYLAEGEIYIAGKKGVQVRILKKRPVCIPDYKFIVYQCIAKREYMDFIIEKYSELGVTDIIPVISNRSLDSLKSSAYERYSDSKRSCNTVRKRSCGSNSSCSKIRKNKACSR